MPNQTVKNGLKAKKIKLPQMIFFFSKNNKIFMYLLAPFILQIFKRILRADPELSGCVIFGNKMAHLFWTNFFWYKPLLLLLSTCWPFALCKIYKKFLQRIQSYEDGPKMVHLSLTIFLENYYHYYPFHCAKFQKNPSSGSRVMRMCNFWA